MTWRGNSSYAGGQGNRAGERFMRLRLFDRIRRLAHSRRSPVEAAGASGVQGRHRRNGRRRPAPGGPPTELAHTAAPWPGGPPAGQAPLPSGSPVGLADLAPPDRAPAVRVSDSQPPDGRLPAERTGAGPGPPASGPPAPRPGRGSGPSALRAGVARARIREAPQEVA